MAKNSNKTNMSFNMALIVLSLLFLITIAESRSILGDDMGGRDGLMVKPPGAAALGPGPASRCQGPALMGGMSPNPSPPSPSTPTCEKVVGVVSGDTCYDIAQSHKLGTDKFNSINPNVNCDDLFIGQWLCVKGTA